MFVRFRAETGDAMGMNMLSKVREERLEYMIIIKLHVYNNNEYNCHDNVHV